MADTYWLTFRIHDDAGYQTTYDKLVKAVEDCVSGKWWYETTSFYMLSSDLDANAIAAALKKSIRPDRDLIVLGKTEYKTGKVIGHCTDADLFDLAPFMKKA